jgi:hypothetical protein
MSISEVYGEYSKSKLPPAFPSSLTGQDAARPSSPIQWPSLLNCQRSRDIKTVCGLLLTIKQEMGGAEGKVAYIGEPLRCYISRILNRSRY